MSKLFEKTTINDMTLANRFVRSATWEGMADEDGSCTSRLTDLMVELARGEVGLIITGHTYVRREGQAGIRQLGVYDDKLLPGLSKMTEAVHKSGGKIVMQLAHAGCHAAAHLTELEPLGPSVMENKKGPICREITLKEIQEIVNAFGEGAVRAQKAGFDGVQIHGAHGYFLSQFLSPFYNRREDEYGGSIENRARIVLEVFRSIRAAVGDHFPILIKINSEDFVEGGQTQEDMLQAVAMLEKEGIDAIELSGGSQRSKPALSPVRVGKLDSEEKEAYYREAARRYKKKTGVPLMLVGGIRSYDVAEKLTDEGIADYISLCRPLIREPHLIRRWKAGDTRKSPCLSDNLCFKPTMKGQGLYCVTEERENSASA